ncbi:MAG: tyrosine-type recombinase/integrase [Kofleriaceae bacterium]|nr:tyrosine-type recombinase/integrase [Kofleriaceae bacterium]MCL4223118.1 tyrosine-type recombinase/integrase [Myxococcales bacterium]
MARQRNKNRRVLGPYPKGDGFQIVDVKENGEREHFKFSTKEAADAAIAALTDEINRPKKTIRDALNDYETYMRVDKGNKENSIDQTGRKLRRFFDDLDIALNDLTFAKCEALYTAMRTSKRKPQKRNPPPAGSTPTPVPEPKSISVDYHRNALSETKTFLRWCVKKGWLASNPLEDVEGVGKRSHGKEQLRIDEARKWLAKAVELAEAGEDGAVAAMMTLLLGIRCSEVVSRVVRDLDDDGRLLWIPDSKTAKGRRTLVVPDELRPYLQELAEGKKPQDLLLGYHDRAWPRTWVQRICEEAGVPVVTAHGNRGLHGTLSIEAGVTPRAVADALGHESFQQTTARSYVQPEAMGQAKQKRALTVLNGGKARDADAA